MERTAVRSNRPRRAALQTVERTTLVREERGASANDLQRPTALSLAAVSCRRSCLSSVPLIVSAGSGKAKRTLAVNEATSPRLHHLRRISASLKQRLGPQARAKCPHHKKQVLHSSGAPNRQRLDPR
jgi:hypothetical protein